MSWKAKDKKYIWHPFTQMATAAPPQVVVAAEGPWLILEGGERVLDTIGSWWVTVHGHAHPHIAKAIADQAHKLEQVIFAGFTHPQAVSLGERIIQAMEGWQDRVFFSDNGSTAVEVALKMAWQYWQNRGETRTTLLALEGAYHGDTFGAMAVSEPSVFTKPFEQLLFDVEFLPSPAQGDLEAYFTALEQELAAGKVACLILEPMVQGAGGMGMYGAEVLDRTVRMAREAGVLVIFDEVMTGFYRTGKLFAADHLEHKPDLVCLSKGLTGGFLPMGLTTCREEIFEAFLDEDLVRMFSHGHSFTANPLGCAAANASLDLFEKKETREAVAELCAVQQQAVQRFQDHPRVGNARAAGTIFAFDFVNDGPHGYLNAVGRKVGEWFMERKVFVRPLGNTFYTMPPYTIGRANLERVYDLLEELLEVVPVN